MKKIYIWICAILFSTIISATVDAKTCAQIERDWNNSTENDRPVLRNHQKLCIPELRNQAARTINGGGFTNRNCGAIADQVEGYMDGRSPRRADALNDYGECESSFRNSSKNDIYDLVQREGDGYHLVWGGTRADGTGHFANLVNIGGEVYMVDFYNNPSSFYSGQPNILNAMNSYSDFMYTDNFQGRPDLDNTCPNSDQRRKVSTSESCGKACASDESSDATCEEDTVSSNEPESPGGSNSNLASTPNPTSPNVCNRCWESWQALLRMSIRFAQIANENENGTAGGATAANWNQRTQDYFDKIRECCLPENMRERCGQFEAPVIQQMCLGQ